MKIFLDSYYFFPFIQIGIDNCEIQDLENLFNNTNYTIYRSEISLFEISAKGSKYITTNILDMKDLTEGLNLISTLPTVQPIPIHLSEIQILAHKFHQNHSDFIDCLILASAISFSDALITEDLKLMTKCEKKWKEIINTINPTFQIINVQKLKPF